MLTRARILIWVKVFATVYLGGWAILAFTLWQIVPDDPAFFRIWVFPAAAIATAITAANHPTP